MCVPTHSKSTADPAPRSLDARSLRGLAHPLRVEIVSLLSLEGPATSTTLAERLRVRTGTTSWHLQKLAEHGFIAEIPERGNHRDRWWRLVTEELSIDASAFLDDAELGDSATVVMAAVISQGATRATQFWYEDWPKPWRKAAMVNITDGLQLTPERLAQLKEDLREVVRRYAAKPSKGSSAKQVVLQMQGFPYRGSGRLRSDAPSERASPEQHS